MISGTTKVFGIIGDPLFHTKSPEFWNNAFEELNMNAVYVPFKVSPGDLKQALSGIKKLNVQGVNITMPHKKSAAALCDCLHYPANLIGSVNTLKVSQQKIEGWNTDALALVEIFAELDNSAPVLVIGDGASADAVIWALLQQKFLNISRISRKMKKPPFESLITFLPWDEQSLLNSLKISQVVINATSVTTYADEFFELVIKNMDSQKTYIDLNYSTPLVERIEESHCKKIDGRTLLHLQGIKSFEILTGVMPPEKLVYDTIFGLN